MDDDIKRTKTTKPAGAGEKELQTGFKPRREETRLRPCNESDAMFAQLQEILLDGLRHGFFDCQITCELVKDRKRRVVIKAGKSHQFTIREEDLQT
jgi:hypothetical protein